LSAAGTLAGGSYAKTAGDMQRTAAYSQAEQVENNAAQTFASGQRKMLDTQEKTRALISSSTARAAASGVNAGVGSPATNAGDIEQRGSYHALMDMFNGASAATGMRNQAAAIRYSGDIAEYEGEAKKRRLLSHRGGHARRLGRQHDETYGKFAYPTSRGSFGA
jgi:hypothetical protein